MSSSNSDPCSHKGELQDAGGLEQEAVRNRKISRSGNKQVIKVVDK